MRLGIVQSPHIGGFVIIVLILVFILLILMGFLPIYIYIILISLLASLFVYSNPNPNHKYLKSFPPFLIATIIIEVLASYFWSIGKNNMLLYNSFTAIEFCFYLWIISRIIKSKRVKKIILITVIFYFISALINILFIQGMKTFHNITYSLGCLLVVVFCIYYFLELFRLPKSEKLYTNPAFWISSALLFFYCCSFPLYGLIIYWDKKIPKLILNNLENIFTILNISLYSLFTIAFLCIRTRKSTLSQS